MNNVHNLWCLFQISKFISFQDIVTLHKNQENGKISKNFVWSNRISRSLHLVDHFEISISQNLEKCTYSYIFQFFISFSIRDIHCQKALRSRWVGPDQFISLNDKAGPGDDDFP